MSYPIHTKKETQTHYVWICSCFSRINKAAQLCWSWITSLVVSETVFGVQNYPKSVSCGRKMCQTVRIWGPWCQFCCISVRMRTIYIHTADHMTYFQYNAAYMTLHQKVMVLMEAVTIDFDGPELHTISLTWIMNVWIYEQTICFNNYYTIPKSALWLGPPIQVLLF